MSALLGLVDALSCRLIVSGVSIELTQHRFRHGAGGRCGELGLHDVYSTVCFLHGFAEGN